MTHNSESLQDTIGRLAKIFDEDTACYYALAVAGFSNLRRLYDFHSSPYQASDEMCLEHPEFEGRLISNIQLVAKTVEEVVPTRFRALRKRIIEGLTSNLWVHRLLDDPFWRYAPPIDKRSFLTQTTRNLFQTIDNRHFSNSRHGFLSFDAPWANVPNRVRGNSLIDPEQESDALNGFIGRLHKERLLTFWARDEVRAREDNELSESVRVLNRRKNHRDRTIYVNAQRLRTFAELYAIRSKVAEEYYQELSVAFFLSDFMHAVFLDSCFYQAVASVFELIYLTDEIGGSMKLEEYSRQNKSRVSLDTTTRLEDLCRAARPVPYLPREEPVLRVVEAPESMSASAARAHRADKRVLQTFHRFIREWRRSRFADRIGVVLDHAELIPLSLRAIIRDLATEDMTDGARVEFYEVDYVARGAAPSPSTHNRIDEATEVGLPRESSLELRCDLKVYLPDNYDHYRRIRPPVIRRMLSNLYFAPRFDRHVAELILSAVGQALDDAVWHDLVCTQEPLICADRGDWYHVTQSERTAAELEIGPVRSLPRKTVSEVIRYIQKMLKETDDNEQRAVMRFDLIQWLFMIKPHSFWIRKYLEAYAYALTEWNPAQMSRLVVLGYKLDVPRHLDQYGLHWEADMMAGTVGWQCIMEDIRMRQQLIQVDDALRLASKLAGVVTDRMCAAALIRACAHIQVRVQYVSEAARSLKGTFKDSRIAPAAFLQYVQTCQLCGYSKEEQVAWQSLLPRTGVAADRAYLMNLMHMAHQGQLKEWLEANPSKANETTNSLLEQLAWCVQFVLAGELDEARRLLKVITARWPDTPLRLAAAAGLGAVSSSPEMEIRAHEEAMHDFKRLRSDPGLLLRQAVLLHRMGRQADAKRCCEAVIDLRPQSLDGYYALLWIHSENGEEKQKYEALDRLTTSLYDQRWHYILSSVAFDSAWMDRWSDYMLLFRAFEPRDEVCSESRFVVMEPHDIARTVLTLAELAMHHFHLQNLDDIPFDDMMSWFARFCPGFLQFSQGELLAQDSLSFKVSRDGTPETLILAMYKNMYSCEWTLHAFDRRSVARIEYQANGKVSRFRPRHEPALIECRPDDGPSRDPVIIIQRDPVPTT